MRAVYPFTYHRPTCLADAVAAYAAADQPRYLAGGQTLLPPLKMRLAQASDLIDLSRLPGLRGVSWEGGALHIGAMTRHAEVAASAEARAHLPALAGLAARIGDPHIRNMGTLGGSLANNDPAADYPAAVLGLGATLLTDRRVLAAETFFTGMFETALEPGEIITSVVFPLPRRAAYARFCNPASRYPIVGVFVAEMADGPRVAVTGAAACVFRHFAMEEALRASFSPQAAVAALPDDLSSDLNSDLHATAAYRAHLIGVMAHRAVQGAVQAAGQD